MPFMFVIKLHAYVPRSTTGNPFWKFSRKNGMWEESRQFGFDVSSCIAYRAPPFTSFQRETKFVPFSQTNVMVLVCEASRWRYAELMAAEGRS